MPDLTLLDLAARTGSDPVIGLVESAISYAPELSFFNVLPKKGTSYKVTRRTALPTAQFSANGAGVPTSKSTYVQETKDLYFMDTELEVPDGIVQGSDDELGDLLAQEAEGAVQSSFFHLAQQIYYGGLTPAQAPSNYAVDSFGFPGIIDLIGGDATYQISAGGASGSSTSAYLVAIHDQGASLAASEGKSSSMTVQPWIKQQVIVSGSGKSALKQQAYVSAFNGWFGFTVANLYSVYRISNIDATHPLTDKLGNQLLSLIPTQFRKGLRWMMNEVGHFSLQNARSAVGYQPAGSTGNPGYAPAPTELAGMPITVTSTILNTEQ
jgi:hypothetical protein